MRINRATFHGRAFARGYCASRVHLRVGRRTSERRWGDFTGTIAARAGPEAEAAQPRAFTETNAPIPREPRPNERFGGYAAK